MKFNIGDVVKLNIKKKIYLSGFETGDICKIDKIDKRDSFDKSYRIYRLRDNRFGWAREDELELAELQIAVHKTGLSIGENIIIDGCKGTIEIREPIDIDKYNAAYLGDYNKGEEKYMKILEIYEKRKKEEIYKKTDELVENIKSEDKVQKIIQETENQLNVLLNRDEYNRITLDNQNLMEDETVKKIKSINLKQEKELTSLEKLIEEIKAQLEITENYDQKMCILVRYGVLNEQWKIDDGKEEEKKSVKRKVK